MNRTRKNIRSVISYIPILKKILKKRGTAPVSGNYYYNNYITHLSLLQKHGFIKGGILAELGPGDTLGIGISALLDGFEKYYAFDTIPHADVKKNLNVLSDIQQLTMSEKSSVAELREDLLNNQTKLKYITDWNCNNNPLLNESLDLILSNAVLEHVLNLEQTYRLMWNWLKPGGWCSHVIDYGAHEFSNKWFEHWYFKSIYWKFLMHGRMYPINRYPHSYHIKIVKNIGFEVVYEEKTIDRNADINKISTEIKKYFETEDLSISSSHIILRKPQ